MDRNQKIVLSVIGILVLFAIGYSARKIANNHPATEVKINKVDAPKGQVVAGFPTELILDSKASTDQSYTITTSENQQYTATYKSDLAAAALQKSYSTYLTKNGYRIINQNSTDQVSSIYATKDSGSVNVVISRLPQSSKTDVTITYLK